MVCQACEQKLQKVACPDKWKEGSNNTSATRKLNQNALLSKSKKYAPYKTQHKCLTCKSNLHQEGKYCHGCAYAKGLCAMCGKSILDTKSYKQSKNMEPGLGDGGDGDAAAAAPPGAWPISARPARAPGNGPEGSMHHGGSFKTYFAVKNLKLQEQFEAQALAATPASALFRGVSIHVNGLTVPSHLELKQIMALHGGRFETYYHRGRVTHIVCANLPDTKLKQLAHARDPVPVVRPEWIVASLRAGQVLPVKDFLLPGLRDAPGQRQLFEFARHAADALAPAEVYPALGQRQQQAQQQQGQQQQEQQQGQQGQQPEREQRGQGLQEQSAGEAELEPQQPAPQPQQAPPLQPQQAAPPQPQQAAQQAPPPQPEQASLQAARATAAGLRAACDLLKGPPRSTADDPQGFMGSFFRSSRLHFIGSWKARIEALMAEAPQQQQHAQHAQAQRAQAQRRPAAAAGPRGAGGERVVVHIDMDCFFAAVAAVGRPEFAGKPLAVCHSASAAGSGEVSSANYEARRCGIRAGMFMAAAKAACPGLLVVPYEFEKYEEVSEQVYRILLRATPLVAPLSCDEAFLDITGLTQDPHAYVAAIREEIRAATQCTASAGIGPNMLLARLATKAAKPNGQALIAAGGEARQVLGDLEVGELPGVGYSLKGKLAELGITHVRQVWSSSKEVLMRRLGAQTGASLWAHAHGLDERRVEPPRARRSVGAEVNWGVRFAADADAQAFLKELCGEVAARLAGGGVRGRCITLKIKRRQAGAPEPAKFLGHGVCDNLSRSVTLGRFVAGAGELYDQAAGLLAAMRIPAPEIRGVGITVSKLDSDAASLSARPSGPAPAKVAPAKHGVFNPDRQPAWLTALQKQSGWLVGQQESNKQQQEQQGAGTVEQAAGENNAEGGDEQRQLGKRPASSGEAAAGGEAGTPAKRRRAAGASPAAVGDQRTLEGLLAARQQQLEEQARAALPAHLAAAGGSPAGASSPAGAASPRQSPSQADLDPDVLAELPPSVRKELEAEYHQQQQQQQQRPAGAAGAAGAGRANASPGGDRGSRRPQQRQPPVQHGGGIRGRPAAAVGAGRRPAGKAQQQRQFSSYGTSLALVGDKRGRQGAPSTRLPQRPEVLTHLHQVDPAVLAELPAELQRELRAALVGKPRRLPPSAAPASGGLAAAAAGPGGAAGARGRTEQQARAAVPGGRLAAQQTLFADEPLANVLAALSAALDALAPVGGGDEAGGGCDDAGGAARKLAVLAEYLAQWAAARADADLGAVQRLLRASAAAGAARPRFAASAAALAAGVQAHLLARFGFRLRL
ncbi:REV1 [Scenedesmus sp. PABB004]|nr:REV1 [Scenedesmus sp. PABB004]